MSAYREPAPEPPPVPAAPEAARPVEPVWPHHDPYRDYRIAPCLVCGALRGMSDVALAAAGLPMSMVGAPCPVCALRARVEALEAERVAMLDATLIAPLLDRIAALEAAEAARRTPNPPECMACLRSDCPGPANCGPAFLAARRAEAR